MVKFFDGLVQDCTGCVSLSYLVRERLMPEVLLTNHAFVRLDDLLVALATRLQRSLGLRHSFALAALLGVQYGILLLDRGQ